MKQVLVFSIVLVAFSPAVRASDFRFCDMNGIVQSATIYVGNRARVFDLSVLVSSAEKAEGKLGKMGYTDCHEYLGQKVDIRVHIPEKFGKPSHGDLISFSYASVDVINASGKWSTSINASLQQYQTASTGDVR